MLDGGKVCLNHYDCILYQSIAFLACLCTGSLCLIFVCNSSVSCTSQPIIINSERFVIRSMKNKIR